jgi:multicomponent Na+:H+ antiporter subunit F
MSIWLVAAAILLALLLPCLALCALGRAIDGLIAIELAGVITSTTLILLAEGLHRESFVDLALVFAVLTFAGSLGFARLMEERV